MMDFPFLSLSLSSLCVIYPTRGRSVHSKTPNGLQRVPTGYNGLERVPTGSNGFDGGGGRIKGNFTNKNIPS
ncbi:MAG: hypothetical protein ACK55Z_11700 [bacterium]